MKKLLALMAVAGFMAACNSGDDANGEDTTSVGVDTATTVAPVDTSAHTDTTHGAGTDTTQR